MTIGTRIKNLRQNEKTSQVDLAKKVGVSKQTLYKYENDIITNIPSDKIELIAKELNTTPAYLMGWSEKDYAHKIVEIAKNATVTLKSITVYEDDGSEKLEDLFYSLNYFGRKKAIEQLELLTKIPEYLDDNNPDQGGSRPDTSLDEENK